MKNSIAGTFKYSAASSRILRRSQIQWRLHWRKCHSDANSAKLQCWQLLRRGLYNHHSTCTVNFSAQVRVEWASIGRWRFHLYEWELPYSNHQPWRVKRRWVRHHKKPRLLGLGKWRLHCQVGPWRVNDERLLFIHRHGRSFRKLRIYQLDDSCHQDLWRGWAWKHIKIVCQICTRDRPYNFEYFISERSYRAFKWRLRSDFRISHWARAAQFRPRDRTDDIYKHKRREGYRLLNRHLQQRWFGGRIIQPNKDHWGVED